MGNLTELLKGVQKDVLLKNYTTFKIGGRAKYFFVAKNKKDLVSAVSAARKTGTPFFVLGGGSNILFSDRGFSGLIIKNEAKNFRIIKNNVIAESGAILAKIIAVVVQKGLAGIEQGSGIPGTLGGAIFGNAGWPKSGWAIGDLVASATLLMPDGKIKKKGKKWLNFSYRDSRLKKIKNEKPIILEAVLNLKKGRAETLKKEQQEILITRLNKIPKGFSAGSVFKNPAGKSAGELIEQCGLKGEKIGRAQISEKHANFIINLGGAKAKDVKKLITLAKTRVIDRFGVKLEEEIVVL